MKDKLRRFNIINIPKDREKVEELFELLEVEQGPFLSVDQFLEEPGDYVWDEGPGDEEDDGYGSWAYPEEYSEDFGDSPEDIEEITIAFSKTTTITYEDFYKKFMKPTNLSDIYKEY